MSMLPSDRFQASLGALRSSDDSLASEEEFKRTFLSASPPNRASFVHMTSTNLNNSFGMSMASPIHSNLTTQLSTNNWPQLNNSMNGITTATAAAMTGGAALNLSNISLGGGAATHNISVNAGGGAAAANNNAGSGGGSMDSCEQIFNGRVPIILQSSIRESRVRDLTLNVEKLNIASSSSGQPILSITLTDQMDPYFLYTLQVSETDFHQLKKEQTLLVDFAAFPKSFVCLLQQCLECRNQEHPKFVAVMNYGENESESVLSVQETNEFRHLQHIALKLRSGNDETLKRYLGTTLMAFKQENALLRKELNETRQALTRSKRDRDSAQDYATQIKSKTEKAICDLQTSHAQESSQERANALEMQEEIRKEGLSERNAMEKEWKLEVKQWEVKHGQLVTAHNSLESTKLKLENSLQKTQSSLKQMQTDYEDMKSQLTTLRDSVKDLDSIKFSNEKQINESRMTIAAMEQQIKDRNEISQNSAQLLRSEKEQKRALDEQNQMLKSGLEKSEKKVRECIKEINKGNNIISHLQNEIRSQRSKNKLKSQQINALEAKCDTNDAGSDRLRTEMSGKDTSIENLRSETQQLKDALRSCKEKLEQSHKALESNQRVISYLNKQINDKQMGGNLFATPNNSALQSNFGSGLGASGLGASGLGSNNGLSGNTFRMSSNLASPYLSKPYQSSGAHLNTTSPFNTTSPAPISGFSTGASKMASSASHQSGMNVSPITQQPRQQKSVSQSGNSESKQVSSYF